MFVITEKVVGISKSICQLTVETGVCSELSRDGACTIVKVIRLNYCNN